MLLQDCPGQVACRNCSGRHPGGGCIQGRVQANMGGWLVCRSCTKSLSCHVSTTCDEAFSMKVLKNAVKVVTSFGCK